jgi:mannose-6-phosphate isomerase-like protein (cupin superfamily)
MSLPTVDPEVLVDNEHTRTVRRTLPPGTAIGRHVHPLPYVVVPLVPGTLTFSDGAGDREVMLAPGTATFRPAGIDHDVSNRSATTVDFIELEIRPAG